MGVISTLTGTKCTPDELWDASKLSFSFVSGWTPITAYSLVVIPLGFGVYRIVQRSNRCLDYVFTCYFLHFLTVSVYAGVPRNWDWWLTNFIALVLTVFLSNFFAFAKKCEQ